MKKTTKTQHRTQLAISTDIITEMRSSGLDDYSWFPGHKTDGPLSALCQEMHALLGGNKNIIDCDYDADLFSISADATSGYVGATYNVTVYGDIDLREDTPVLTLDVLGGCDIG